MSIKTAVLLCHALTKKRQVHDGENDPSRPQAENCAGAALPTPHIEILKGAAALRAAKPKKDAKFLRARFVSLVHIFFVLILPHLYSAGDKDTLYSIA